MPPDDGARLADVREAAVRLLARREHSAQELRTKLVHKGWSQADVEQVLADLAEAGLQSERRFAESFARQRAGRFYGPRRIAAELAQRGIDSALSAEVIESLQVDFAELAAEYYARKFGSTDGELGFAERAKRSQAMYRRGFEAEHVRGLI